jgi:hypothetical protein
MTQVSSVCEIDHFTRSPRDIDLVADTLSRSALERGLFKAARRVSRDEEGKIEFILEAGDGPTVFHRDLGLWMATELFRLN